MAAFSPNLESEIQVRSPGPAPIQNNSSSAAIGGFTQAIKILGSKFGNSRSNSGPTQAQQNTANNQGFINGVTKIQAMEQQGASPQQVQTQKQVLMRNFVSAGGDFGDESLSKSYEMITGAKFEDFGTTAQQRVEGGTGTDRDQLVQGIIQQTGKTEEEAITEAAKMTSTAIAFEANEKNLQLGAKVSWGETARVRMDMADLLFEQFQNSFGAMIKDENGVPKGFENQLTEEQGQMMLTQAQTFAAKAKLLPSHTDPNDPNVKSFISYIDNMQKSTEELVKLTSLDVQNNTERQNFNKLLKEYATTQNSDGDPTNDINPVTLATLLVSSNGDLMSTLAAGPGMDILMRDVANIKLGAVKGEFGNKPVGVDANSVISEGVTKETEGLNTGDTTSEGATFEKGKEPLDWQIYERGTPPKEMVSHMKYQGTWAKFSTAEFIDATPEGKKTYVNSAMNLGLIMSTSKGVFSKKFIEDNFPSANMLSNLEHIEKTDPDSARYVRKSVLTGLVSQTAALENQIQKLSDDTIWRYEFDEETGKYYTDKDVMTRINNGPIFENEVRERGQAVGYELSEDGNRLYVPDDHTGALKSIISSKETLELIKGYESDWTPEAEAEVTTNADGSISKQDLPPATAAEPETMEVPEAVINSGDVSGASADGIPIPADTPVREDFAKQAKALVDSGDSPEKILERMSKLVKDQEAAVLAFAEEAATAKSGGQQAIEAQLAGGTSMMASFTGGEGGLDAMNKGTSGGKIIGGTQKGTLNGKPVSKNTVGEISKAQSAKEVFAVGSMQIIPSTMKEVIAAGVVKSTDVFDQPTQEKVFEYLVKTKRPEVGAFLDGKSDDMNAALIGMSKEFASWPDPSTGKSRYGSGNKAQFSVEEAKAKLMAFRKGEPEVVKGPGLMALDKKSWRSSVSNYAADDSDATGDVSKSDFDLQDVEQSNPALAALEKVQSATKVEIADRSTDVGRSWNFGKMKANSLVVHHTAGRGTVEGVIQTFKDRNFPAHFVVDRKGKIHQILGLDQRGQHTKNSSINDISNKNSWGVEVIARDDKDITPEQVDATMRLSKYLNETQGMPMDRIFGHGEINTHKRATEGKTIVTALRASQKNTGDK